MKVFVIIFVVVITLILIGFFFYFNRQIDIFSLHNLKLNSNGVIKSPAQGNVLSIFEKEGKVNVWIYLNFFDIHRQYSSIDGKVIYKKEIQGQFHPAYLFEKSQYNTRTITGILDFSSGNIIYITQIAGQMARTIINNYQIGDIINKGDQLGRILLGSSVIISIDKENLSEMLVEKGQNVNIGTSLFKQTGNLN